MSDWIQRKKNLMEERERLLETIGEQIFQKGEFSSEFLTLPRTFLRLDTFIKQLQDRLIPLKEEREKVYLEHRGVLQKIKSIQSEFSDVEKPLEQELKKVKLQIECSVTSDSGKRKKVDKSGDGPSDPVQGGISEAMLKTYQTRRADLRESIKESNRFKRDALEEPSTHAVKLSERLDYLDRCIWQLRAEREHLTNKKKKHLRDLAHHHRRYKKSDVFDGEYQRMDDLSRELESIRPEPRRIDLIFNGETENKTQWFGIVFVLLVLACLMYIARTRYLSGDVSLAAVTNNFMQDGKDSRLYADMDLAKNISLGAAVPNLTELPGGAAFTLADQAELRAFAYARSTEGEIHWTFFGARFRRNIGRFSGKLRQLGWAYMPTRFQWEALSNGVYTWLIVNDRELLLLPKEQVNALEGTSLAPRPEYFSLKQPIQFFDNNSPFLQGYDVLFLELEKDKFRVQFDASEPPYDLAQRKDLLGRISARANDLVHQYRFEQDRFVIQGDIKHFTLTELSPESMREFITGLIEPLEKHSAVTVAAGLASNGAESDARTLPPGNAEVTPLETTIPKRVFSVRVYASSLDKGVAEAVVNEEVRALCVSPSAPNAYAVWGWRGVLQKFSFSNGVLSPVARLAFGGEAGHEGTVVGEREQITYTDLDMQPSFAGISKGGKYIALVDPRPEKNDEPRLALVSTDSMNLTWSDHLPGYVRYAIRAEWDDDGETLYVGCHANSGGGRAGRAILVYERIGERLTLLKGVELPGKDSDIFVGSALQFDPMRRRLLIYNDAAGSLSGYQISENHVAEPELIAQLPLIGSSKYLNPLDFNNRIMALNRSFDHAVVLESRGGHGDVDVFLVNLNPGTPENVTSLALDGTPFSIVRIPLRDAFWVSVPDRNQLALLEMRSGSIEVVKRVSLGGHQPRLVASNRWGDTLVVSTIAKKPQPGLQPQP